MKLLLLLMLLPSLLLAADVDLSITATTDKPTTIKVHYWESSEATPDTSVGSAWTTSFLADNSGVFDTGIAAAIADADSSVVLTWTASSGYLKYIIQHNYNEEGWHFIADPLQAVETYTHEMTNTVKPRRGKNNYRIYAINIAGVDTTWSAVDILPSAYLNQAVEISTRFLAHDGTASVVSPIRSWVYRSSVGADTDPPDTVGVFVSAAFDTTDTDDVEIDVTLDAAEAVKAWVQWKNAYNGTYAPASETWLPSTASAAEFTTSIATGAATSALAGDTLYVRFKLQDTEGTPNVGEWHNLTTPIAKVFEREADAVSLPGTPSEHWDSMASTNLTLDGTDVTLWEPESGSYDLEEYNSANAPSYSATNQINSNTAVYFDGTEYMHTSDLYRIGGDDYTMAIVFEADDSTRWDLWNIAGSDTRQCLPVGRGTSTYYFFQGGTYLTLGDASDLDGYHNMIVTWDTSADLYNAWLDGVQVVDDGTWGTVQSDSYLKFTIGSRYRSSDTYGFTGCVGEILVYDSILSDTDVGNLDSYFGRWD